ncbi:MAG: hypothetical protein COT38_03105 [Candidatus Omnitrophica bacterium CG08_land_8_20_14_0_20_41_16]|nr:MAG: hypothetical protein COT38_03105 [Candidatus Omnitrophica bacterium CG08_land_8_20_14_0_20_41_16]
MKKLIFLLMLVFVLSFLYAGQSYNAYISTAPTTIYSARSQVDLFVVANSSVTAQWVDIGDGSTTTLKMTIYCPASNTIIVPIPGYIKFDTSVIATTLNDDWNNKKVKLIINIK